MDKKLWLVGFAVSTLASCRLIECGDGTLEEEGVCVASQVDQPPVCGQGFYFDSVSGTCRSNAFDDAGVGVCDPETTITIVDDAGVVHCVGVGGTIDCDRPITCPAPSGPAFISVCGRLFDTETSQPLDDGNPDNGEPHKGVEIRFYEPLGFVADPGGAPTVGMAQYFPDSCGRFAAIDLPRQASGFIAVAVEDNTIDADPSDLYLLTGSATDTAPGELITGFMGFVTKKSTLASWDASAMAGGCAPAGAFGDIGVYLPIFLDPLEEPHLFPFHAVPASGVTITEGATSTQPTKDFYFSDTEPLLRTTIDCGLAATGPNGSGLMINTGLMNHSGVGNEPNDGMTMCSWPVTLSASIAGVVFVQERLPGDAECN